MTTPSIEEILRKYPALKPFAANEDAVRQLYETMNPKRDIKDFTKDDQVKDIEVLIVRVIGNSYYIGCPNCFKKLNIDEGISVVCQSDRCKGEQRVGTKLYKWTLLAGDASTKVILEFPPFGFKMTNGEEYVAKVVKVTGRVGEPRVRKNKETGEVESTTPTITVRDMRVVSDIRDTGVGSLDAVSEPMSPSPPPAPTPPTPNLPAEKVAGFKTWVTVITQNGKKPVPEAQIKAYVETRLGLKFEDLTSYLKKEEHEDGTTSYTLA